MLSWNHNGEYFLNSKKIFFHKFFLSSSIFSALVIFSLFLFDTPTLLFFSLFLSDPSPSFLLLLFLFFTPPSNLSQKKNSTDCIAGLFNPFIGLDSACHLCPSAAAAAEVCGEFSYNIFDDSYFYILNFLCNVALSHAKKKLI